MRITWSLQNIPFREAHEITGKTVAHCIDNGKTLEQLTLAELQKISKKIKKDVLGYLKVEQSVKRKNVYGGTAPNRVEEQIKRLN